MRGLGVTGGPIFPAGRHRPRGPDGELIVANGSGGAFVGFYRDVREARRLEPEASQSARRFGGRAERRGAVTVVWINPPASGLRASVRACAFGAAA